MAVVPPEFFSRDELATGFGARRATTLLFAIESRTAHVVARSRRAMAYFLTERSAADREQAFLAALASGRDRLDPTVQDIERHADRWADLVPRDPDTRAGLARLLGTKYAFGEDRVPRIRATLGLDDEPVAAAFRRLHGEPVESIYATELPVGQRIRWVTSRLADRLERLPAFWTAFALTLTETVGTGVLALPIALASIGPAGAVVLLLVFGLVNVLTVAALVEAITRNGPMRYGTAYFDGLVGDYLGRPGRLVLSPALFVLNAVTLLVALVGFGSVLGTATGLPIWVWAAVLFAVDLAFLRRESLDATVASAIVVGLVNLGLLAILSLLALSSTDPGRFARLDLPILNGRPLDGAVLSLVFGVVMMSFFGHTSAANAAKVVLDKDPSGRAILYGNAAAMVTVMVVYCVVVVAITSAVDPAALAGYAGTALGPLADRVGPIVNVLGSVYAILAVGLGSVFCALGLYNQTIELIGAGRLTRRGRNVRFLLGAAPAVAIFVAVEWLIVTGQASFAGPVGFLGVLTVPILGGVFPMLMVAAARRSGERIPGRVVAALGHPLVIVGVFALYLAAVIAHGLVIWQAPHERIAALATAVVIVVVAALVINNGSLRKRTIVELRDEAGIHPRTVVAVADAGRAGRAEVRFDKRSAMTGSTGEAILPALAGLQSVEVSVERPGGTLRVWAHRVSAEGDSSPIGAPAVVTIQEAMAEGDGGTTVVRLDTAPRRSAPAPSPAADLISSQGPTPGFET